MNVCEAKEAELHVSFKREKAVWRELKFQFEMGGRPFYVLELPMESRKKGNVAVSSALGSSLYIKSKKYQSLDVHRGDVPRETTVKKL